jgi:hypothetical protein
VAWLVRAICGCSQVLTYLARCTACRQQLQRAAQEHTNLLVIGAVSWELMGCKGLGGLPYTENRENNQSAFRLPSG